MAKTGERTPGLIVFDLDYTLWPFWVDTHVSPPFCKDHFGNIHDVVRKKIELYPDVMDILDKLRESGITLAVASRTSAISDARTLLKMMNINTYFKYKEIYPGSKTKHFQKFKETSGIPYSDMLFFDDEPRNIRDVSELGVTCILAENGLTWRCFNDGIRQFTSCKPGVSKQRTLKEYFQPKDS